MNIEVTPASQEFAARLGRAGVIRDADGIDSILAEIAAGGVDAVLAVLAVQTGNLVTLLSLQQGPEMARKIFERTILDAGAVIDE